MDVKLKLEHVVWLKRREELNPSLDAARSNCRRLSSNWYPPITIEVLGFAPPSTNPRHSTSPLTNTIEFAPKILQTTLLFCRTRPMVGTAAPPRVLYTFFELKQTLNGATAATLVMFMEAAALMKALVKALYMEVSMTV